MRINVKFKETPDTINLNSVADEKALELKSTELLLQGLKGKDGVSPIVDMEKTDGVTTLTIIDESGPHATKIYDGERGEAGPRGERGPQGERGESIIGPQGQRGEIGPIGPAGPKGDKGDRGESGESIVGPQGPAGDRGPEGARGPQGESGYTPQKGIDYYTPSEKEELIREISSAVGGLEYVFLSEDDVDESGKPNFDGERNKFYFVPDENGTSPNLFTEWLYTDIGWEIIGNSKINLDGYATETWVEGKGYLTEHQSLAEYAKKTDIPTIPTNVSAFTNDSGYLTEHQDLSEYAKKTDLPKIPEKISAFTNDSGYLTIETLPKWGGESR